MPSHTKNLADNNDNINFERLLNAIGWEYLRTTALTLEDGGNELIGKQRGFQLINPTDQWFPGKFFHFIIIIINITRGFIIIIIHTVIILHCRFG